MPDDAVRRTAVVRPPDSVARASRGGRRWRVVVAVVLAGLIGAAGTGLGTILSEGSQGSVSASSIRLASPEEAAAATGSRAQVDAEQPAEPGRAADPPTGDGPRQEGGPGVEELSDSLAAPVDPSPSTVPPQYPAPPVIGEPVVAVAEAISPSVVRIEVNSEAVFGVVASGIVWDAHNGHIVTNWHVVEDADTVTVAFSDGARVEGTVVGGSSSHDVAVVQVDPGATELVAATFAPTSSVRVGQLAVAVGSPLGLTGTVTAGIVSAVRIQVQGGSDPASPVPVEMIQTDAAINRGNSGGALADWRGRVIGMNTLIQTTTGSSIGLGFAVPSDTVELIATRIVNGESLELGYLGVSGKPAEGGGPGVTVLEVMSGSPADKAGLMAGDVIVSLESEPMEDISELSAAIKLRRPGEEVELTIRRGDVVLVATVVLGVLG